MEPPDLEEVPLTDQERTDIAEAWLGEILAVPRGAEPNLEALIHGRIFLAIVNQIIRSHQFEPGSAEFRWRADARLTLMARRGATANSAHREKK